MTEPDEQHERAEEARALLDAPLEENETYRRLPHERAVEQRLLDVVAILSPGDPLSAADLRDFRRFWAWVHRQDISWETWEPGIPPTGDFDSLVLDGRPDLTDPSNDEAAEWLANENTDAWASIAHGHDGHRFLVWDTSRSPEIVVHAIDNQEPEVITGTWRGVSEVLRDLVIEDLLPRPAPRAPPDTIDDWLALGGCALLIVVVIAGVVWWLM